MQATRKRLQYLIIASILLILPLVTASTILYFRGPEWDVMSHALNGRTMLNYISLHEVSFEAAFAGEFVNNLVYYFEPYRAPLATPIFAFLSIFLAEPILAYTILLYIGVAAAVYKASKELGVEPLVMLSAFFSPYALYFFFLPNSMEGLSIAFVLLGIVYLMRRSAWSGLFFGLAGLAKYPPLILLPLVILLWEKRKAAAAIGLEALAILPWLAFNYIVYGHPLYSYIAAVSNIVTSARYTTVHPFAVFVALMYPIAFGVAALVAWRLGGAKARTRVRGMLSSYRFRVLASFAVLSLIGYAFVLPHNDFFTQERFGYLASTALVLLMVALFYNSVPERSRYKLSRIVALAAIAILAVNLYYTYATTNVPTVRYYNPNAQGNVFQNATSELGALGFANCRFVSNAWVEMLYLHYPAYSPFTLYTSGVITPMVEHLAAQQGLHYSQYVKSQEEYPIVVIDNAGVSQSLILNLGNSTMVYNRSDIQIYLPKNTSCYDSN